VGHLVLEQRPVVAGLVDGAIGRLVARQLLRPGGGEIFVRLHGGAALQQQRGGSTGGQDQEALVAHRLLLTYCSIWSVVEMALEFIS
jgi:hypothetical protein